MRARTRTLTTTEDPWACRCKPKSYVIGHFVNQELVSVTRMHNRTDRNGRPQDCHLAPEELDPREWDGRR